MEYQAKFEPEKDGGFVVTFPDFGYGVTQGDDQQEATNNAAEVIQLMIEDHIRAGKVLPRPKVHRGSLFRSVRLPLLTVVKAELHSIFLRAGITKAELAKRLGMPRMNVDRLFDVHHNSRLDQLEAAFEALEGRVEIGVKPLAHTGIRVAASGRVPERSARRQRV
ncbi:MAG: type II toxin-antitoxin system HicB family antitoxin [Bryobacteraceae bacterium]